MTTDTPRGIDARSGETREAGLDPKDESPSRQGAPDLLATIESQAERIGELEQHALTARSRGIEEAARVAETLPIGGGTLSSWINTNESPMGATRRHIAKAIRALSPLPAREDVEGRVCILCDKTKPITDFSAMHDGSQCKECRKWP